AKYLIETEGVSPGFRGTDGATPLHSAARGGHLTVVSYLVDEQGVDPSSRDRNQLTPLDYAKNDDVKNFLASRGAKGSQQKKFQPVTLPNATSLLSKQQSHPKPELRRPSLVLPNGEMSTG
ncbi:Ankyrin repeat domain-containing protein 31, partial [Geodia barretti]